jgi:hypothetical protein
MVGHNMPHASYALLSEEEKQELHALSDQFVAVYTAWAERGESFHKYEIQKRGDLYYVVANNKTLLEIATRSESVLRKLMWDAGIHYGR